MKLWKWVAEQQAKYYNAHHKAASFQMKDKVLLQSINIHTLRSKKKIDHRQLRSFRILKKINMQAYKLELSEKYDVIHSIFHVSLLRFWHSRDENSKLQIILVEEEEEWKIEKILDQRIKKEKIEYLVQWADSSLYENFWKSMKNLSNAKKIIENYETERQVHQLTAKKSKEKKETDHVRITIERISKAQRRESKKLILNYNYKISRNICLLKKKTTNIMKERRKEAINDRERERRSEERSYLFISESRHALLASVDTYETKTKRHDDDKKWRRRERWELLLNC